MHGSHKSDSGIVLKRLTQENPYNEYNYFMRPTRQAFSQKIKIEVGAHIVTYSLFDSLVIQFSCNWMEKLCTDSNAKVFCGTQPDERQKPNKKLQKCPPITWQ